MRARALELALVQQAQAGGDEAEHGGRLVLRQGECRRRPRLVVVLQEARQMRLPCRIGREQVAHTRPVACDQRIVQVLVVGEVEAPGDHLAIAAPVHLRHQAEVRVRRVQARDDALPEVLDGASGEGGRPRSAGTPRAAAASPCRSAARRSGRRCRAAPRPSPPASGDWRSRAARCRPSPGNTDRARAPAPWIRHPGRPAVASPAAARRDRPRCQA